VNADKVFEKAAEVLYNRDNRKKIGGSKAYGFSK
jgi:hypothetical protein